MLHPVLWLPLVEETSTPQQDLASASAAFQVEPTGQRSSQAAALRLVRAHLATLSSIRHAAQTGYEKQIQDVYGEAKELALEQLQGSEAGSWGEAAMLLALAEVHVDKRSSEDFRLKDFDEALENVEAARVAFRETGDTRTEAQTWLVAADIHRRREVASNCTTLREGSTKTFDALDQAKNLFEASGDLAGMARAKHGLAIAHVFRNELNEGLELLEEAYQHFVNEGNKLYEAIELLARAQLHFRKRSWEAGQAALQMAEEALEILVGYGSACGHRLSEAHRTVVEAHLLMGDIKSGMRLAQDWADASENQPRQHCCALIILALTWFADQNSSEAMRIMEQAVMVSQEAGDEVLEFDCLLQTSQMHSHNLETEQGLTLAMRAIDIAQGRQERRREAVAISVLNQAHFKNVWAAERLDEEEIQTYVQRVEDQCAIWLELEEEGRAASVRLGTVGMLGTSGRYEAGRDLAEDLAEKLRALQDKTGEAQALLFLTELYSDLQKFSQALDKAREMRQCGRVLRDEHVISRAWRAQSKTYYREKKFKEAITCAERALGIVERVHDMEGVVDCLITVANYCTDGATWQEASETSPREVKGNSRSSLTKKALGKSKTALNLARRLQNKRLEGSALVCLGKVQFLLAVGRDGSPSLIDDALTCFKESFNIFQKEPGCTELKATAAAKVARVHLYLRHWDKAMDAAEAAVEIARLSSDIGAVAALQEALMVLQRVREQWPDAMFYSDSEFHTERPFARRSWPRQPEESQQPPPEGRPSDQGSFTEPFEERYKEKDQAQFLAKVHSLDLFEIKDAVMDMLKTVISSAEGQGSADSQVLLHVDTALADVGIDSLTAITVRNGLHLRTGVKLDGTWVHSFPTARELARHLTTQSLARSLAEQM